MPLNETCPYCGAEVSPHASKCSACGEYLDEVDTRRRREPESQDDSGFLPPQKKTGPHGTAIASLILGIVSLFLWLCSCVGLGAPLAGLITGFIAISKRGPKGMAVAGIIMSAIGLILNIAKEIWAFWWVTHHDPGSNPFGP
jgi:predicted anti-sigma-YlaC factor YlaD